MTREEAIIILDCERPYGNCGCGASIEEIEDALNIAIKSLEQDSILDKIRAEIMNLTDGEMPERIWNVDVLQIIDKYKGKGARNHE